MKIGPYHVLQTLAEGATGELFLVESPEGRRVALKRLKLDVLLDDGALARFEREAGTLRSFEHVGLPHFVDSGVDEAGIPYLVQTHIPGETLAKAVAGGRRFDTVSAERLARGLLQALIYLHALHPPVLHRDIKPANVILSEHGPVLVDFGAAASAAVIVGRADGTIVGTFGYMAPEMLKGHASPAADLYSLGATLLFAFSGRQPEDFPQERLTIRFRDSLNLPAHLLDLLEALLAPAVEDRPKSAQEALALLEHGARARALVPKGEAPARRDDGPVVKTPPSALRRRLRRAAVFGAVGLAIYLLYELGPTYVHDLIRDVGIGIGVLLLVLLIVLTLIGGF